MNYVRTNIKVNWKGFEGRLLFTRYVYNQEIAIVLEDSNGPIATATVNVQGARRASPRGVWLKGWSENEGLPKALEDAGVVKLTNEFHPTGFVNAQYAEFTEIGLRAMEGLPEEGA